MQTNPKLRFKDKNGNSYPDWEENSMEYFGTFFKGNNLSKSDLTKNGYPCILYGELYTKYSEITKKILSYTNRLETNQIIGYINDVLIPSSGETAIDISTATCLQVNGVLLGGDLNIFRPKEQDGRFISYELNHKKRNKIASIAQGATVVHLYPNFLKKLKITLPCLEEQEKIAGFLSKMDELINECEAEVKDLEEQKKGLLQKIFSQQIRFKDSNNNPYPDWEEKVMDDILNEYCKKNYISNQYPVLTSSRQGLMLQTEYYSGENRITEKNNIGFNIIPPNYITYRSRSDDGLFTFNMNTLGISGIVSTYYPVFSTNCNNLFVTTYLNINKNNLFKYAVGSSQKVLSLNELKKVKIHLPCEEEQEKIAEVLSKMDELIEEKKALLSDWHQFKKGLLQQMFV